MNRFLLPLLIIGACFSCANDRPFLAGHIRRAYDAILTTCEPYNSGRMHSCVIFSSAFQESLYVYDATAAEMVLAPNPYFPLKNKVGPSTDELVSVVTDNKRFPFFLAVDRASSHYFPIRLFPQVTNMSFQETKPERLFSKPHRMAAVDMGDRVMVMATFPDVHQIGLFAIDKETGKIDDTLLPLIFDVPGRSPNRVVIDKGNRAVISDKEAKDLLVIDVTSAYDGLKKRVAPKVKPLNIDMTSDRLYLSRRDLGNGVELYAVVMSAFGKEVKLVNIDREEVQSSLLLSFIPTAGYFPDKNSDECCNGVKNWFSVVSIKGELQYISIKNSQGSITLDKSDRVDLTLESNLAVNKVHIVKILGGAIERDPAVKKEALCPGSREVF